MSWQFHPVESGYELDTGVQEINEAILKSFVRTARAADSQPMVVFLPEFQEFRQSSGILSDRDLLGRRVARRAGVELLDLTSCLEAVPTGLRFTTGWHYTPQANRAVAHCLQAQILEAATVIQKRKSVTW